MLTSTDSAGHTLTFLYDALDRPKRVTFPDATFEETTYTAMDATKVRDRLGRLTTTRFNALRQPVCMEDSLGRFLQLEWCRCGDIRKLFDGAGNETHWKSDVLGRVFEKRYADGRTETMTFQPLSGRLATITDAKSQSKTVRYNVDYTAAVNPAANVSFSYDPVYPRLAKVVSGFNRHRVALEKKRASFEGASFSARNLRLYSGAVSAEAADYDALGRTKTRNIGTGTTENLVTWNFDTLGRLDDTLSPLGAVDYVYVAQTERLDRVNLPNGARTQFGYFGASGDHRLQQIKHLAVAANPASIVSQHDYTYDAEGQIATWARVLGAASSTFALGYDNAGQLASATLTGTAGTIDRHAYTYDKAGNRRSSQRNLALTQWAANNRNQLTTQSGGGKLRVAGHLNEPAKVTVNGTKATVNAANQYEAFVDVTPGANTLAVTATDYAPTPNARTTSWSVNVTGGTPATFAYDLNGNMTSDGTRTFAWDSENRLKSVTIGASVWSWDYDGMNRRIRERLNGTIQRQWVWCGTERCEERNAANTVTRRFYTEGELQGTTALYYTRDHLGSIRELLDSTATVRARYDYTPYGERTKQTGDFDTDRAFTGHELHNPTGLTLAPFRTYDAALGRWISPDPIAENGGINLYGYAFSNPIRFIDPLGLEVFGTFDIGTGVLAVTEPKSGKTQVIKAYSGGNPYGAPIPIGDYDILDHPKNDFLRLEPKDSKYGNDKCETSGRDNFRLHKPGRSIGCVTAKDAKPWDSMRDFIRGTPASTSTVDSKSKNPFASSTEKIKNFGTLKVIDTSKIPLPPGTSK